MRYGAGRGKSHHGYTWMRYSRYLLNPEDFKTLQHLIIPEKITGFLFRV